MNCRRAWFLIFTVPILLALAAPQASAQLAGNPFLIEHTPGDPVHGAIVTDTDNSHLATTNSIPPCDSPSPQACKQTDPVTSNGKELGPINGTNTKIEPINHAPLPVLGLTNPNAQVDLQVGYTQSAFGTTQTTANHVFFYFGWRRASNSGSGFLSVEIDKAPIGDSLLNNAAANACKFDTATNAQLIAGCNPWAARTTGDFVLLWDQSGSSQDVFLATFTGGTPGLPLTFGESLTFPDCSHSGTCLNLTQFGCADASFSTDGFAGEMSVDLSCAGVFSASAQQCETLATIIPGTVTGNSNQADYKDVILAPFPPITNCGRISVTKVTLNPNGTKRIDTTSLFGYTIKNGVSGDRLRYDADQPKHTEDGGTPQIQIVRADLTGCANTTTCEGPVETHTELITSGAYTLKETTIDPNYKLTKLQCISPTGGTKTLAPTAPATTLDNTTAVLGSITVAPNELTVCVITNQFQQVAATPSSIQTVKLFDAIRMTSTTPFTKQSGSGTVSLSLYTDSTCTTLASGTNPQTLTLSYSVNDTQADGNSLGGSGISVSIAPQGAGTYYWAFTWGGDDLHFGLTKADTCTESTQIVFSPAQ
jgi:hypothetical protein